jgi:hypothetical protein
MSNIITEEDIDKEIAALARYMLTRPLLQHPDALEYILTVFMERLNVAGNLEEDSSDGKIIH